MTLPPSLQRVWRIAQNLQSARGGAAAVVLDIGDDATHVAAGAGPAPELIATLAIGARRTGVGEFRHDPPTPGEMEVAIMTVEDEVMPLAARLPPAAALYTAGAGIRQIAHIAGLADTPQIVLPRDDVERVYNLLAAVALGRPASISGVRTDPPFTATLTILREFMHHLGFTEITILTSHPTPSPA